VHALDMMPMSLVVPLTDKNIKNGILHFVFRLKPVIRNRIRKFKFRQTKNCLFWKGLGT